MKKRRRPTSLEMTVGGAAEVVAEAEWEGERVGLLRSK